MTHITIAIDAMGGDRGLSVTVPAALHAAKKHPNLHLVLVGQEKRIQRMLQKHKASKHPQLRVHHAEEIVSMDESPALALRSKKDSSMRVAMNLVKEGEADAAVSAGNTGALMATARFVLKTLPGVDRPAIVYALPSFNPKTGQMTTVHMLDLGANIDCTADHLVDFAVMGSVLVKAVHNIRRPRVALLNIGEEEIKGLESIKQAAKMLSERKDTNYVGFVEGNGVFFNKADVVVCDGFVGNVALKTTEGVAQLLSRMIKHSIQSSFFGRLLAILALPVLWKIKKRCDIRRYNGASFLGLKGIVVKSHGGADSLAFATAIEEAVSEVDKAVPSQIHKQLEKLLGDNA